MRKFRDLEFDTIITEEELLRTFKHLQREQPDEYNYSFENYIRNCTDKDGTLEEIHEWVGNARVIDSLSELPRVGEEEPYRGLVVSVELYDDEDDYVIYRVFFLDGKYIAKDVDIAYWSYAIHKDNMKLSTKTNQFIKINKKNIKNEKENRTMKTYNKKIEIINDIDEICEGMSPACYDERQNNEGSVKYTWKDIVLINGKCYAEEFEISGLMDGDDVYQIDSFLEAVAEKYGVDVDDVQTYMMNDIHFDPKNLPWGAAECGCYIDGKAEWL